MSAPDVPFSTTILQVRAAREGDRAAQEDLFTRYEPRVVEIVRRRLGAELRCFVEIEDVVQVSMHDALLAIHGYDESEGEFIALLARIVENNIRDFRRRFDVRRRHGDVRIDPGSESTQPAPQLASDREPSPSQAARVGEIEAAMQRALEQLHPTYRKIILLRDMRNLGYEAIAAELGYTRPETARVKCAVAKKRLRELMSGFAP